MPRPDIPDPTPLDEAIWTLYLATRGMEGDLAAVAYWVGRAAGALFPHRRQLLVNAAYRAANPEKVRAAQRRHRATDQYRSRHRASVAADRALHREEIRARERARYAADPDRVRGQVAAYRAANPEKVRASHAKYHARVASDPEWRARRNARARAAYARQKAASA